jgi:hypothetical protein
MWNFASKNLFYCSDDVPVLNFIPPFIHPGPYGDQFFVNPFFVYSLWCLLVIQIFTLPYLLTKKLI